MSAGWWVAIVALWPASSRPFIDGSPDNSILNLITGYNGLGRIFGSSGPGGGGGGGANFSGATGPLRLFNELMGGQASWLLPAALLALVAGLWARRRAPRTDRARAALLLWGGWLIVTAVVFSFGQGVIHTYYTVALAPAIGALVAIGGALLWPHRHTLAARVARGARGRRHRRVGVRAARPHPVVRAVAATGDRGLRRPGRARSAGSARSRPSRPPRESGRGAPRRRRLPRRTGGLRRGHGHDPAHRLDPVGRTGERRRPRRRRLRRRRSGRRLRRPDGRRTRRWPAEWPRVPRWRHAAFGRERRGCAGALRRRLERGARRRALAPAAPARPAAWTPRSAPRSCAICAAAQAATAGWPRPRARRARRASSWPPVTR